MEGRLEAPVLRRSPDEPGSAQWGNGKSLELSDRGGRIPALLLIIMKPAVNLDLLCSRSILLSGCSVTRTPGQRTGPKCPAATARQQREKRGRGQQCCSSTKQVDPYLSFASIIDLFSRDLMKSKQQGSSQLSVGGERGGSKVKVLRLPPAAATNLFSVSLDSTKILLQFY